MLIKIFEWLLGWWVIKCDYCTKSIRLKNTYKTDKKQLVCEGCMWYLLHKGFKDTIESDNINTQKNVTHCRCEFPMWKNEDLEHCVRCGKLLPNIKKGGNNEIK